MNPGELTGTWRLLSYEARSDDGDVVYPLGPDPEGYIMYTDDGFMSVTMVAADRTPHASGDLKGGTEEEKIAAAESYIGYCGRYELKEDRVVHHVEFSFFQNRVGTSQERFFRLVDGKLVLRTPPMLVSGQERELDIVWERARDES
jgi:hypothetical protein